MIVEWQKKIAVVSRKKDTYKRSLKRVFPLLKHKYLDLLLKFFQTDSHLL